MFSIHRLHLADVDIKGAFNPPTFLDSRIPVYGFLLRGSNEAVLVDTGVGESNEYIDRTFRPQRFSLKELLATHGVATHDVTTIVNSHLHFDHCGNNALFGSARFYVQSRELEIARAGRYTIREWFDFPGADIEPVDEDLELDNGIRLIATPGHTPGHQSVLVPTSEGSALIVAQATFTHDEFLRGGDPDTQSHEGLGQAYMQSLKRLKEMTPHVLFFSHDTDHLNRVSDV